MIVEAMGKTKKLVQKAQKVNASVLEVTVINNTGLYSEYKKQQIYKWMENGDRDVIIVTETLLTKELENTNLFHGYECVFSSLHKNKSHARGNNPDDIRGKWGVAAVIKKEIRVGKRLQGEGVLEGRVVAVETFFTYKAEVKPLWIVGVYAPVEKGDQPAFYSALNFFLDGNIKGALVIGGDFNGHMEEHNYAIRDYEVEAEDNPPFLREFVRVRNLADSYIVSAGGLEENYTFASKENRYKTRLDYAFVNKPEALLGHEVVYDSLFTSAHFPVIAKYDLSKLVGGKKVTYDFYQPSKAIMVDLREEEKIELYHLQLEEWRTTINNDTYVKATSYTPDTGDDEWMEENLNGLIDLCTDALVTRAKKIWVKETPRHRPFINKEIGIKLGHLAWLRRAGKQLAEAADKGHFIDTGGDVLAGNTELGIEGFQPVNLGNEDRRHEHYVALYKKRREIWLEIRKQERIWRKEKKKSWQTLIVREGKRNSALFRKLRFKKERIRDGELVLSKNNIILDKPAQITERHGEYFSDLLGEEEAKDTTPEPGRVEEQFWWDENKIKNRREKVTRAGGDNLDALTATPTLQEYFESIDTSNTNAKGGLDDLQFGPIQAATFEVHLLIFSIILFLWKNIALPKGANIIEIVCIPKGFATFDLFEKRGIGLASKWTLILEGIFIIRLQKILDKAGVRSKGQGGATKGVTIADINVAFNNIIAHAIRYNVELHAFSIDLHKFFDRIPHRGFADSLRFFGFGENVVKLASLFWSGFKGRARSRFGLSTEFDIGVGNIQGLRGSPLRSVIFLDMLLIFLEETKWGYEFFTSKYRTGEREHLLDTVKLIIPGLSWIDDFVFLASNYDNIVKIVTKMNDFISHYRMRLTFNKCEHHIRPVGKTIKSYAPITLTDFKGDTKSVKIFGPHAAIKLLGTTTNLNLRFERQNELAMDKAIECAELVGSGWSPAKITARMLNSDILSKFTHVMHTANLKTPTINKIQSMMARSVWKDGRYSRQIPFDAFLLTDAVAGHSLAKVTAVYQSIKISTLFRSLNSSFFILGTTTRMTHVDLKRQQGSRISPLEDKTRVSAYSKGNFPPYMTSAINMMTDHNLRGVEREDVLFKDMLIVTALRTFSKDIPNLNLAITMLSNQGVTHMDQISEFFKAHYRVKSNKLSYADLLVISYDEGMARVVMPDPPTLLTLDGKGIFKYGEKCHRSIERAMMELVKDITSSKTYAKHVPLDVRRYLYIKGLAKPMYTDYLKGNSLVATDGSYKTYASYGIAVKGNTSGIASSVPNLQTSQRGELFGLLMATANAEDDKSITIIADPLPIINTINKGKYEGFPTNESGGERTTPY
jgi:exonuclease III